MAYTPFRNIGLKFLSICIATLLWLVVAGDRVVERALRVPIEFQNLPQGLEIVGDSPESVDVRLRGSSGTIGRLGPGDMSAVIDLRSARPGRRLFHLGANEIHVPYGIEVMQVAPATLPIGFENSAIRIVQVRPSVEGRPAPGYEVGTVTSQPATVEVIGPESSLRGFDEAMTEPVSVAGATRPLREVVTIGVADPRVRLRTPQTAAVTVQIMPGSSTRTLSAIPIAVRNLESGLSARPSPAIITVTVRGTQVASSSVTVESLDAHVDASGLGVGEHAVDVRVRAGQGLTVEAVTPESLRLRIIKQPQ
ncbi:MAG TPA: CdaR family protein [Vicinamibacterales bacterium]|nr:CdaR family protein [Vicinamibacterales bacterium]